MSELVDEFDPLETARAIEKSYRDYIASTVHFANEDYQRQLESLLARAGCRGACCLRVARCGFGARSVV